MSFLLWCLHLKKYLSSNLYVFKIRIVYGESDCGENYLLTCVKSIFMFLILLILFNTN